MRTRNGVYDCHKKYTYAVVEDEKGRVHWEGKSSMSGGLWLRSSKKVPARKPGGRGDRRELVLDRGGDRTNGLRSETGACCQG